MHPFCRSITVPDTASRNGTRWARDPVTGKSITVPADMTYQQWYDKYVKAEKALKNNYKGDTISGGRAPNYYEPFEFNPNASFNVSLDDCSKEVNEGISRGRKNKD